MAASAGAASPTTKRKRSNSIREMLNTKAESFCETMTQAKLRTILQNQNLMAGLACIKMFGLSEIFFGDENRPEGGWLSEAEQLAQLKEFCSVHKKAITTAYRRLARAWHPDKNPDRLEKVEGLFKLLRRARELCLVFSGDATPGEAAALRKQQEDYQVHMTQANAQQAAARDVAAKAANAAARDAFTSASNPFADDVDESSSDMGGGGGGGGTSGTKDEADDDEAARAVLARTRTELAELLRKYDRDHLPQLDALMAKHAGREVWLLEYLTARYKIKALLERYDPEKLGQFDQLLQKFKGRETALFERLKSRYAIKELLRRFDPGKLEKLDALMVKYKGREDQLLQLLKKKYMGQQQQKQKQKQEQPASAGTTGASHLDRLVALLRQHDPERLPRAKEVLGKYAGREEELLAMLTAKYAKRATRGPEGAGAGAGGAAAGPPSSGGGAAEKRAQIRQKLVKLLQKHDPSKLSHIDEVLAKYALREEELLARLEAKYEARANATATRDQGARAARPGTGEGQGSKRRMQFLKSVAAAARAARVKAADAHVAAVAAADAAAAAGRPQSIVLPLLAASRIAAASAAAVAAESKRIEDELRAAAAAGTRWPPKPSSKPGSARAPAPAAPAPEPGPSPPVPATATMSITITPEALSAFYQKQGLSDRVAAVPTILQAYPAADLLSMLRDKYGEVPAYTTVAADTATQELKPTRANIESFFAEENARAASATPAPQFKASPRIGKPTNVRHVAGHGASAAAAGIKTVRQRNARKKKGRAVPAPTRPGHEAREWACERCTFLNKPAAMMCEICGLARTPSASSASPSIPIAVVVSGMDDDPAGILGSGDVNAVFDMDEVDVRAGSGGIWVDQEDDMGVPDDMI